MKEAQLGEGSLAVQKNMLRIRYIATYVNLEDTRRLTEQTQSPMCMKMRLFGSDLICIVLDQCASSLQLTKSSESEEQEYMLFYMRSQP